MAGNLNRVLLMGRVAADPEIHLSATGRKVVRFTLVTQETWTDRASGDRQERHENHRMVVLNEALADFAAKHVKAGARVFVEGMNSTRRYVDAERAERFITEVVLGNFKATLELLDSKADRLAAAAAAAAIPVEKARW